ncbi:I78 family peptidase inhibitor [Pseudomonas saudiphocaensis]|uniref:I78 family peptidase inhibitor n=1 Tax=Pseudomonas saudiphocaensis TaxID=1499686 RepID=UPI000F7891EC|nr:I78 family peptidase inhibitor [Pseudomonas saudiphocaensis]RRV16968.1 peptidase inhibitor I78 family protein [Pseudomonas saudiphocaensis]
MKTTRTSILILLGVALAGCQALTPDHSPSAAGDCNAAAVQELVGKQASPELLDQSRRDSGARVARLLRPGDVVTLEYNAQRLNLTTDEDGRIQRVSCG